MDGPCHFLCRHEGIIEFIRRSQRHLRDRPLSGLSQSVEGFDSSHLFGLYWNDDSPLIRPARAGMAAAEFANFQSLFIPSLGMKGD